MAAADPILILTDGTTEIDLLHPGQGWHLRSWRPQVADWKNGGTWQDSPLSDGRRLRARRYANVIDTYVLALDGHDQDNVIRQLQEMLRLGDESAADYWASAWSDTPVYLKARSGKETNTRYALIYRARIPELEGVYFQPFFPMADNPILDNLTLIVEHDQWQSTVPSESDAVEVSSTFDWSGTSAWESLTTTPTGDVTSLFQTSTGRLLAGTNDTGKIYSSDDGGSTWSLLATAGSGASDAVNDFTEGGGKLYAALGGTNFGVYESDDDGATWSLLGDGGFKSECNAVLYYSADSKLYIAGDFEFSGSDGYRLAVMNLAGSVSVSTSQWGGARSCDGPDSVEQW